MRIVFLGDIHVYELRVRLWHLLCKRALGHANLLLRRRHQFKQERLPDTVARAAGLTPDLTLFAGDLTTTALPAEFAAAQNALAPLLSGAPAFMVPGNHDRYTFTASRSKRFEHHFGTHTAASWPHLRRLGANLVLIGLDPTRPNILTDRGELGEAQLERLERLLESLNPDDRVIVLCHYTIGGPAGHEPERPRHAMLDVVPLIETLGGPRPTLYLHGHVHEPWCFRSGVSRNIISINAGAPVMVNRAWPGGQGFWEIETDPDSTTVDWKLTHHVADAAGKWRACPVALPTDEAPIARIPCTTD